MVALLKRDADGYLPIEGYAAVGNGRTVALVGCDGAIDWCCLPRLDATFVLDRLLDAGRGGFFSVAPHGEHTWVERGYIEGTNILQTTWCTASTRATLTDWMPPDGSTLVRRFECIEGDVSVDVAFRGAAEGPKPCPSSDGCTLSTAMERQTVRLAAPAPWEPTEEGVWRHEVHLRAGESRVWTMSWGGDESFAESRSDTEDSFRRTLEHWSARSGEIAYVGRYRDAVVRSALVLQLLVQQPTGALAAAATTSLPEQIGGERNWDYRLAWLRDSALVLEALMQLGLHEQAMHFWEWVEGLHIAQGNDLQIMYTLDGSAHLPERTLDAYQGYRRSRPVRVGNDASKQVQLDAYGYLLDAAYVCQTKMRQPHPNLMPLLRHLADEAASRWREPDRGLWEMRGPPQHFLHSKVMCWVALDRAVKLSQRGWLSGDSSRWSAARDELRQVLLEQGYDAERGYFAQTLRGTDLDAASLVLPLAGVLPASDPRMLSTIDAVRGMLSQEGLVRRYLHDDGFGAGDEGAFLICSFWLVEALALAGRGDEAKALFERLLERRNDVGLLSEQIDPKTGAFLGNFPQAFSHLALIRAALALEPQADRS